MPLLRPQAAESFALCTVAWGWVRPGALPRRLDVLLFSLASASILHCYSDHLGERRCVFRSSYLRVFDVRRVLLFRGRGREELLLLLQAGA